MIKKEKENSNYYIDIFLKGVHKYLYIQLVLIKFFMKMNLIKYITIKTIFLLI